MKLIGDLLYPNNAEEASKLNQEQQTLQKKNALHNELVNNYSELTRQIRTFDAYLMAILVMQYYMVYTKEDLENLPETKTPEITQSIADKIETIALDALSIKMSYNGIKAIGSKIANVVNESGSFKNSIANGPEAVADELQPELNKIATQTDIIRSGNVDVLTETEATPEELKKLAVELGKSVEKIGDVSDLGKLGEEQAAEITKTVSSATDGAGVAAETVGALDYIDAAVAEAGLEGAVAGAGAGMATILRPAAVILILVTETIGAIDYWGETPEKLERIVKQMPKMHAMSDKSVSNLKKALKSLLNCLKLDIITYNKVLKKLYQLEGNAVYNKSFNTDGVESFINGIDSISVSNNSDIAGFTAAVMENLNPALTAIKAQAEQDSYMTSVISLIKSHIRATGNPDVGESYLQDLAAVEGISFSRVKRFDILRQRINQYASVLAPYHKQVQSETPPGSKLPSKPSNPQFGQPDRNFDAKPGDFKIPGVG